MGRHKSGLGTTWAKRLQMSTLAFWGLKSSYYSTPGQ